MADSDHPSDPLAVAAYTKYSRRAEEEDARVAAGTEGPRPEICFVEWGPIPEDHDVEHRVGQMGFHLENDGNAAHEISIERFAIDPSVWAATAQIPRISRGGKGFAFTWLEGCFPIDARKWDLKTAMHDAAAAAGRLARDAPDYRIQITAVYRDSRNIRYRSTADLTYIASQDRLQFGATSHETLSVPMEALDVIESKPRTVDDPEARQMKEEVASRDAAETGTPASIHKYVPADGSIHPSKGGAGWKADDELGDKVHDLLDDYIQRMAESGSDHRKLLAQFAKESYDAHAAKRLELVHPGCQEDVARFDDEHSIRADLAVWQPLRSYGVRLDGDEPDAIELALTSARIRWKKMADRRARKAVHDADKVPPQVFIHQSADDFPDLEPPSAPDGRPGTSESPETLGASPPPCSFGPKGLLEDRPAKKRGEFGLPATEPQESVAEKTPSVEFDSPHSKSNSPKDAATDEIRETFLTTSASQASSPVGAPPDSFAPPRRESFVEGRGNAPDRPRMLKIVRRHPTYVKIDAALRKVAEALPKDQEAVIRALDSRAKIPNAEPFKSAGGWLKGFQKDPRAARVWLSKHWARLGLNPFMRGPK
jgi:hypothetical protein